MKTEYIIGLVLIAAFGAAYLYKNREPQVTNIKKNGNLITFNFLGKQFTHTMGTPSMFSVGDYRLNVRDWTGNIEFRISRNGQFIYGRSGPVSNLIAA